MAPIAVQPSNATSSNGLTSLSPTPSSSKLVLDSTMNLTEIEKVQDGGHVATSATCERASSYQTEINGQATRKRWRPTKYLDPPAPPPPDPKVQEELAAQAAAQALGYEGRRVKRFMQRRTVDYWGSIPYWKMARGIRSCERLDDYLRPSPHQIISLLPPAAYSNSATSVATNLVHTSTNKIRCPVNVVRWTPEGRRLLTGSTSGEFTLWNGLTFNFETILQAHDSAVRAFEWSRSGIWLISSDQNGMIKYFQTNMNNLQAFQGHRDAVRGLSFSPDDSKFVSASDDSTMKIWSFDEAREEKSLTGHGWDVKCVDWHPYKGLIVSGSKDNLVKFWDPRANSALGTFHGHKNTIQACKWSPDGNLVATASRDQAIKLYDIRAMADVYTLKGHKKEVCSVDWHPIHHDLLASGGSEGSVLQWSLKNDNPESPVHAMDEAHESNVWSLHWHPLGHLLCSGSNDHTSRFWSRSRPGDGLPEGQGGDDDQRNRNEAAARKGTDWDNNGEGGEDDLFIPGLSHHQAASMPRSGSNNLFVSGGFIPGPNPSGEGTGNDPGNGGTLPSSASHPNFGPGVNRIAVGSGLDDDEEGAIPGLSFSSSAANNHLQQPSFGGAVNPSQQRFPPLPPPPGGVTMNGGGGGGGFGYQNGINQGQPNGYQSHNSNVGAFGQQNQQHQQQQQQQPRWQGGGNRGWAGRGGGNMGGGGGRNW
ncbi:WD40 repeat-like protein [Violaceomyces palustris]|uniref:WD40 repeat-like protein n=1 Tax=Violaceomyces palustris TaxID=1673888 RepID=A0ACD0NRU6_9BASI|nr:WD40 repeat-like protein [Violaceomyces palustris]